MIGDIVVGLFVYNFVLPLSIVVGLMIITALALGVMSTWCWFESAWKKIKGA